MKGDLCFPKSYYTKGSHLWRIFDQHRNKAGEIMEKVRGDASELLGMYTLMRHFVELRFKDRADEMVNERASFNACCEVVDIFLKMKNAFVDCRSEEGCEGLENVIFAHLQLHIAAYGTDHIKPKHHLNHCLPKQF